MSFKIEEYLNTLKYFIGIMGNANVDPDIKKEIEEILKEKKFKIIYQNVKGFIDNACVKEIEKIKSKKPKSI